MFFPVRRVRARSDSVPARRPRSSFRPGFETLEDRCVPTTLLTLAPGATTLLAFDSANPNTLTGRLPITGLQTGDQLLGIDYRPATGGLYALGNAFARDQNATLRLYTINAGTGAATLVGSGFNATRAGGYSFDFDPFTDQIRVIGTDGSNFRVSPITGTVVATDTLLHGGPGGDASVVTQIAYTPGAAGVGGSTLFGLTATRNLVMIGGPNGTTSANSGALTLVGTPNTERQPADGFEIFADPVRGTQLFLVDTTFISTTNITHLDQIDLATGQITQGGNVGDGTLITTGLAAGPTATFTPPNPPLPPNATTGQRFVSEVFDELLGRRPDQNDLAILGAFIDQGLVDRLQFVLFVEHSPEFFTHVVNQTFQALLGRPADPTALNAGTLFFANGGSLQQFEALLAGSPEFFQRVGGSNTTFVRALFLAATGQTIDSNAQNLLTGLLDAGVSRTDLALFLVKTPQGAQQQVSRFFERFLGREPNAAELAAHAGLVEAGQIRLDAAIILASQELLNSLT